MFKPSGSLECLYRVTKDLIQSWVNQSGDVTDPTSIFGLMVEKTFRWRQSPLEEDLVFAAVSESGPPDPEVLHEAQILDLVPHQHFVKAGWTGRRETQKGSDNVHYS